MFKRYFLIVAIATIGVIGAQAQVSEMESTYNALAERFEVRDKALVNDLKTYLEEYPYTTYADEVHFMIGALYAEKNAFKNALKELKKVEGKRLTRPHQELNRFYLGYCHMMQQEFDEAGVYFGMLVKQEASYRPKDYLYYYSFCQYRLGQYDKALPGFAALEKDKKYNKTIPYFIAQIYYYQGQTDSARVHAQRVIDEYRQDKDNTNVSEMHRILGEISYQEQSYRDAIDHLKYYYDHPIEEVEVNRNDLYFLGRSYYLTKDYTNATTHLKQIKNLKDTISESAFFMMGNAYVQLNQIEQARLSYQGVLDININPTLREEAMFNYTLTTYRTSTALGESVEAFTSFLKAYPQSKHVNEIFRLMSQAFMQSKNYQAALNALDSIHQPTPEMQETKQYLRYQLATDAFTQGKMATVIPWMEMLLTHSGGEQYKKDAYYFMAEAHYRLKDYTSAAEDIKQYLNQAHADKQSNYTAAVYLKAYCAFSQHNYTAAQEDFKTYVTLVSSGDATYADAYNRIGDCYFNARQFSAAIEAYTKVADLNATGSVYALFQKGYAEGLMHQYDKKIETLQNLVSRYPKSDYADDALYEIARAQLQKKDNAAAVVAYQQLLAQYPKSDKARQTHLEIAMLYRNMGQYDTAIDAYKQTISSYPAGEEAYAALAGLEATYMEINRIDEYLAYTKTLSQMHMSITTQDDSLTYTAAELQYMLGNYTEAIKSLNTYLTQYCPGGRYCTTATYYAATAYDQLKNEEEALKKYVDLTQIEGNTYLEEAYSRIATIYYGKQEYALAKDAYERLSQLGLDQKRTYEARMGMIRCLEALSQHQPIIETASLILNDAEDKSNMTDVYYFRAKAYVATQQYGLAIADLSQINKQVETAIGAEAKYLTAECYYKLEALDNAENEIFSFTQQKTQQQYWLAKALILLSDINLKRGDTFQAQQYLLSLQNNYKRTGDDILTIVAEKLEKIE